MHSNLFVYLVKWHSPFIFMKCYYSLLLEYTRWNTQIICIRCVIKLKVYQLQQELKKWRGEKEERRVLLFCYISHLQCLIYRFVYWLIQRDDEHNNRTIDLLYSTVYLWLVMCYVEIIKKQTSGFIPSEHSWVLVFPQVLLLFKNIKRKNKYKQIIFNC